MSMSNTVKLHRVFSAPPERVYKAFLDPDAIVKWMPPHGFTAKLHQMDATVGGSYRMSFTNFSTGTIHSFGGTYAELIPNQRIRYFDRFDNPELAGEIEVIIEIKAIEAFNDIHLAQVLTYLKLSKCKLGLLINFNVTSLKFGIKRVVNGL